MRKGAVILALAIAATACSTTRVLEDGQYRLASNDVSIKGAADVSSSDLTPYIRQDAQSWNPFICVYNWSRKDGLFHKIGKAPEVFDSTSLAPSCDNIAMHMNYLGYYDSEVHSEVRYKKKKAFVNYIVKPGKSYKVSSVEYEIPPRGDFPSDFFSDTAAATAALRGKRLSEQSLEAETVRSSARLRNLGYFDFNKNNYFFEADTLADGTAKLIYRVKEYTRNETEAAARTLNRFYIGKVNIARPADLPFQQSVLSGLNTLKPGDLYREKDVSNTYSRLSSIKVFNSVQVQMTPSDSNKVDCNITLGQAPVQGFKVKVEGSSNSTGLLSFSPQVSFYHKNIFHGGEWFNIGFIGDFQYRISDKTKAIEYGISAGLSFPKIIGIPYSVFKKASIPRTEINAAYNYQNRPEYNRALASLGIGISGSTRHNVSYKIFPLQANFVRLLGLDEEFAKSLERNPFIKYSYQSHLDAGLGASFYYNSSSDIIPQGNYTFHRLGMDLSGNVMSLLRNTMPLNSDGAHCIFGAPYSQYARAEYSIGGARRFGQSDRKAVAVRFLAGVGYAYGNSTALPFEKKFYAGGASSMRGWQARALGPGGELMNDTFIIPSQTGDIKLEANLEYRFSLIRFKNQSMGIEGAAFTDVGNVWTMTGEGNGVFHFKDFYKTLGVDCGFGLRLNLQLILIRIDVGLQIYNPSMPEGSRLVSPSTWLKGNSAIHFGVGYPF